MWIEVHPTHERRKAGEGRIVLGKVIPPLAINMAHVISMRPKAKTEQLIVAMQNCELVCRENYYTFTASLGIK